MMMKIKQISFLFLIGLVSVTANAASLKTADSLFQVNKYTEALEIYQEIFESTNQASPGMLLKMAFISSGSGNDADALFYLNTYFGQTGDREVLEKMKTVAEDRGYLGYEYSDADIFEVYFEKYRFFIAVVLFCIVIICSATLLKAKQIDRSALSIASAQLVFSILLLVCINSEFEDKAVVSSQDALLTSGAGAGAEPVMVLGAGHKVKVLNREVIWTKIQWEDRELFVRSNKLKAI